MANSRNHNSLLVKLCKTFYRSLSAPLAADFTRKGSKLVRELGEGKGREGKGGGVIIVAINLSFVLKQ